MVDAAVLVYAVALAGLAFSRGVRAAPARLLLRLCSVCGASWALAVVGSEYGPGVVLEVLAAGTILYALHGAACRLYVEEADPARRPSHRR